MADDDWVKAVNDEEQKLLNRQLHDITIRTTAAASSNNNASSALSSAPSIAPSAAPIGRGRGRPLIGTGASLQGVGATRSSGANASVAPVQAGATAAVTARKVEDDKHTESDEPETTRADASLVNKLLRSALVNTTSDIEVLRKDPNSPLYHVKNFNDLRLKPELLKGLFSMGFMAPSKIQETALPLLLANPPANMIAQSQSGTGKTAAFVLTMLSRVDQTKAHPQCLCLAPTYELALQIGDVTKKMATHMTNISIGFAIRGEFVERRVPVTHHIVIGTPGTMLDWCTRFKVIDLQKINVFVLDEADVMIDKQGHADQSVRIKRELRHDCQMLLFSATYDEPIMNFAETIVSNPIVIRLKREEESLENIRQYFIQCKNEQDKFEALSNIYGAITIGQCMIFCHTRKTASWLAELMTKQGHSVSMLTGDLDVQQRTGVISRFRAGKEKVLITTNVSARGIDIDQVNIVINFDLPVDFATRRADCETYLHRIGRTGRFGRVGYAINMIDSDRSKQMLADIQAHFGRPIQKLDAENPDEIEKIEQW